jgi:glycosyltransferase involved in cell wall biosynthesis
MSVTAPTEPSLCSEHPVRPLRVALVTARYFPFTGGVETHVHEVATRLARLGAEITVLTTDLTNRLPAIDVRDGFTVRRFAAWPRSPDLYFSPRLYVELRKCSWDLVHVQGVHTLVAPLAMLAAARGRVPYVVTFHTGGHSSSIRSALRPMQWRALRPLLAGAGRLIGVSAFEARLFGSVLNLPKSRFVVIPNGSDPLGDLDGSGIQVSGPPLILSIARLERYKGHHRVIGALPTVLEAFPGAQLIVVGKGPYEHQLRRLAAAGPAAGHVSFLSFASGERLKLGKLIARSRLVTLLSEYEAHPVSVMEALGLNRPVLVADTSGLSELADGGLATGIPLNRSDREIGEKMIDMLQEPQPQPRVRLPGWDDCVDALMQVYKEAITASRVSAR